MNGTKMNASKDKVARGNPFGSRFLTCVAVAVALSVGSAGFAAAAPGSGGGHGGGTGSAGGHPGGFGGAHAPGTGTAPGTGFGSAAGPSEGASGYHSAPIHPGYNHLAPGISAPNNSMPAYSNGPQPGAPVAPPIVVPGPGNAFQWLGDNTLVWVPGYQSPAPQPAPQRGLVPDGSGKPGCDATRPQC